MIAIALPPHVLQVFVCYWLGICVSAVAIDYLLPRSRVVVSVIGAFIFVVACFSYVQFVGVSWSLFADTFWAEDYGFWKEDSPYIPHGEWFDWVLAGPHIVKWFLLPPYTASILVRVVRKLRSRSRPNLAASGNGAIAFLLHSKHPCRAVPEQQRSAV